MLVMANIFTVLGKIRLGFTALWRELIIALPDEFSRIRVSYHNRRGCQISRHVSISPNVRIRGLVIIGEGSSVAQNCTITGLLAGVRLGRNVMIAPNVVIVAFNHGTADALSPMSLQPIEEAAVVIEDDVWVGANVTIGRGVTIGCGSIIGANSFVNVNVAAGSIMAGVPVELIRKR